MVSSLHQARPLGARCGVALVLAAVLPTGTLYARPPTQGETLARGAPVERELAGGQSHRYLVTLARDDLLRVEVDQRGVDVVVTLAGPDGATLVEVDSPNGTNGPEPLEWVAAHAGEYRIEVRSLEAGAPPGRYEARLLEQRPATAQDRALVEGARLVAEADAARRATRYDEALAGATRALEVLEKGLGPEHAEVGRTLNLLAEVYRDKHDIKRALEIQQRAVAVHEKALGPEHPELGNALNNLAGLHGELGDLATAEATFRRAIAIHVKALGPAHEEVANDYNNLASLYQDRGDFDTAIAMFEQSLAVMEKAVGPEHQRVAVILNNIAAAHSKKGDYVKAEAGFRRSLAMKEKLHGAVHPDVAATVNNLAALYHSKGDFEQADPMYRRVVEVLEKTVGPEHFYVGATLTNLADTLRARGRHAAAEPMYVRALGIAEKTFGAGHPNTAVFRNNLALCYYTMGDYAKARPLYEQVLAQGEKVLGPEHPNVGLVLNNLGVLYYATGEYERAEPALRRSLAIREKVFGPSHPDCAVSHNHLAALAMARGDIGRALEHSTLCAAVRDRELSRNLAAGSEREKLAYVRASAGEVDLVLTLHAKLAPADAAARRLAVQTLLQRKGRALDAMTDSIAALRRRASPEDRTLLDGLAEARSRLATATLQGPGGATPEAHRARLAELSDRVERLEAEIGARSAEFRAQSRPVTLDAVQRAIPAGAMLVEFALYRPFDPRNFKREVPLSEARYLAYVLSRSGEPRWVDLGLASTIDAAVDRFRGALRDPKRGDVRRLGRALDERVMRPVRALLGTGGRGRPARLFVSPDGALNLVPFAALVDERGRYLGHRYEIGHLSSGRDLLRLQERVASRERAIVVADPDFGGSGATRGSSRDIEYGPGATLADLRFGPLPGTRGEAAAVGALLRGATVLTRERATEAALKEARGPRVLHVATHGFFLELAAGGTGDRGAPGGASSVENPLLRSGLALSGANTRAATGDDGLLTATEVAGLDLWGTELVVLSACNTGVGEVRAGDGVYGLRRALVLAGSESQVMSLWPVSDRATRDLMVAYYRRLLAGEGRTGALRRVQLSFLRNPRTRHPFYWAGFIQSGAWTPITTSVERR